MEINNIKKYITKKSSVNGFDFMYYLHIRGGSGNWLNKPEKGRNGGEYDFILYYASPDEMKGCNICERVWCIQNKIIYGEGKTIEAAYEDYLNKSTKL